MFLQLMNVTVKKYSFTVINVLDINLFNFFYYIGVNNQINKHSKMEILFVHYRILILKSDNNKQIHI